MKNINLLLILVFIVNINLKSQKWQQSSGIPANEFIFDLASYDNYVFAATMSGIYRSDDYGITWAPKNNGIPTANHKARAFSKSGNKIYVANTYGIFVTENFGENWTDLNLPDNSYSLSVFADDNIILAGVPGGGLYRSVNYGNTWEGVTGDHIYKIAKKDNYYFAGSWGDVVYSNDYGENWQSSNLNEFVYWTFAMNDTIFACSFDGGLFKTAPNNISWKTVNGITDMINGIAVKNDTIFAITSTNIKYSKYSEQNSTWQTLPNNGLPNLVNNKLRSGTFCNNYLVVGTVTDDLSGLGIWYINLSEIFTSVNDKKIENTIAIIPNPANNIININGLQNANIQIFDLTGKLFLEIKNSNNLIDVSNFSNGIYIIKIETADGILKKKFIKY